MNKKIIALAVASLASGVAVAQTNVTMYGVVDTMYVYSQGKAGFNADGINVPGTNKFSGLAGGGGTAGNRLGFKGEEALGNGLKAVFTLEYGLNIDNNSGVGTSGLNARQQFVGLAGNWGTLALGRQYAPAFDATANNDALEATDLGIQSSLSVYSGSTITPNSPARFNNAITYTSPNWSGFTGKAIYGFGESKIDNTYNDNVNSASDNGRLGLGINYNNGPLNVDLVYQSRLQVTVPNCIGDDKFPECSAGSGVSPRTAPGGGKSVNEWYAGANYDFKVVKIYGSYQALDNNNKFLGFGLDEGSSIASSNIWTVGVSAPIGNGVFGLSYGKLSIDRRDNPDGDSWGWGAMYQYNLSKRTALYGAYSYFSNDRYSVPVQAQVAGDGVGVGARGESNYALGAGIRHSF
ncbi:MAG: Outer membrane porin protein 32 [Accumulibacter sp.]|uniref:porin n=1 Tax=Accumulibacter sp. TaxID=2053492 RepID=UPI00120823C6|nr:porin [Accumulibacter sp.]TLD44256.1 MAG: Outer membrane porin protein 32 [Accumulibacter sp.]